jgi:prophage regulatory protein
VNKPKKFLRLPTVIEMVGMKRATIYKWIKAGTFPEPVQLGLRSVAWDQDKIAEWQANRETGVKKELV